MTLSYNEVAEILKIIDASECEEVILELEGARLVVRRGGSGASGAPAALPTSAAAAQTGQATASAPQAPSVPRASAESETSGAHVIRAPMVGTFYRRPSPEDPPFVEEGAKIKAGDPLCLIEVMKLFTTIEATVGGTIASIVAEDGMLVEFDQPLFTIDPA